MKLIGRRNFLAGLGLGAGATLLSPFAKHLIQRAQGQESASRRLVFMNTMNGLGQIDTERWVPSSAELNADTLPVSFGPLASWASKMLIIDYLYNPFNPGQHDNGWATLSLQGHDPAGNVPNQQSWDTWPDTTGISFDI